MVGSFEPVRWAAEDWNLSKGGKEVPWLSVATTGSMAHHVMRSEDPRFEHTQIFVVDLGKAETVPLPHCMPHLPDVAAHVVATEVSTSARL